jgi:hypothetical protein
MIEGDEAKKDAPLPTVLVYDFKPGFAGFHRNAPDQDILALAIEALFGVRLGFAPIDFKASKGFGLVRNCPGEPHTVFHHPRPQIFDPGKVRLAWWPRWGLYTTTCSNCDNTTEENDSY